MSRNQIRFLLGITVLTLVILLSYLSAQVGTESEAIRRLSKTISKESIGQEPVQRMTEFRRIKMQDGRKVWEIVAHKARYFADKNTVLIEGPQVSLYFENGEAVGLRCNEGTLHLADDTQDLVQIDFKGNLEMEFGDVILKTDRAVYDHGKNTISSDSTLYIFGQGFTVKGTGYTVAVNNKQLQLNSAVHTTISQEAG